MRVASTNLHAIHPSMSAYTPIRVRYPPFRCRAFIDGGREGVGIRGRRARTMLVPLPVTFSWFLVDPSGHEVDRPTVLGVFTPQCYQEDALKGAICWVIAGCKEERW